LSAGTAGKCKNRESTLAVLATKEERKMKKKKNMMNL